MKYNEVKKLIGKVDECDDPIFPPERMSAEDKRIIKDIVKILYNKRFSHEGWLEYDFYAHDAAWFILQLLKEKNT